MNIQKDKLEMITTIIAFFSSIIVVINSIYENYNIFFYISLVCALTACILSCLSWLKIYPIWKRYKFIKYLFFEIDENKFNIAPKVLLFLDLKKKKNSFAVKDLSITYSLSKNNEVIDSNVVWSLEEVSNVISNDIYFYAGIDLGKIQNQKLTISCNNRIQTINLLADNVINSGNSIFLYHWDIPKNVVKDGKKIDQIKLSMDQKDSFDFNNTETIYFYPWNFAKKINKVKFKIIYPQSLGKITMQLFEVGKVQGKKFPYHHSLETTVIERFSEETINNTFSYEFYLEKEKLKMENLYYILLHKI